MIDLLNSYPGSHSFTFCSTNFSGSILIQSKNSSGLYEHIVLYSATLEKDWKGTKHIVEKYEEEFLTNRDLYFKFRGGRYILKEPIEVPTIEYLRTRILGAGEYMIELLEDKDGLSPKEYFKGE